MQIKSRIAAPSEYLFQVSSNNSAELSKRQLDQYFADLETDFNSHASNSTYPQVFSSSPKES
jgi:hypothetical protein